MFSPVWLADSANSNLFITTDYWGIGSVTGNSGVCTSNFSTYAIPSNFVFYGLKSFLMWGSTIKWKFD
jgi:hypothetical protein